MRFQAAFAVWFNVFGQTIFYSVVARLGVLGVCVYRLKIVESPTQVNVTIYAFFYRRTRFVAGRGKLHKIEQWRLSWQWEKIISNSSRCFGL